MNNSEVREWLDAEWERALKENAAGSATSADDQVDLLVNSRVSSIRYALITQLLGKIANPDRSLMYLQIGSTEFGAWNARSFCDDVIVPWVTENQNVLGTSAEPYASKPLRRERLEKTMPNVRNKEDWTRLYDFFASLDKSSSSDLEHAMFRCLLAVARRLAALSFKYEVPLRVSLPELRDIFSEFLADSSGGLRPLVVATAAMRVFGKGFKLFESVNSQGINEADSASGVPGDIMCYDADGRIVLAVEVKDRGLTLADIKASIRKSRQTEGSMSNLLFAAPGIQQGDQDSFQATIRSAWTIGLNVYHVEIVEFITHGLVLLDESSRPDLLREIGRELDDRGDPIHRQSWNQILKEFARASEQEV